MSLNKKEPSPILNNEKAAWDLVFLDMKERDLVGQHKYDTRLKILNGRNSLIDAYQEVLDMAVYLRQAIEEKKYLTKMLNNCYDTITWIMQDNMFITDEQIFILKKQQEDVLDILKKIGE